MKKIILATLTCLLFSTHADMKEVFKRIPKKFDAVMKLDLQKVIEMPMYKMMTEGDDEFEEMQKKMQESIGLTEKDVLQVYMCFNSAQFWDMTDFANKNFELCSIRSFHQGSIRIKSKIYLRSQFSTQDRLVLKEN